MTTNISNRDPRDDSLWAATAVPAPDCPTLAGQTEADIVIIGAGYTGLSTALHLATHGMNVVVLEAEVPGFGASGRNGGQVIAGLAGLKHSAEKSVSVYGPELGLRAHAFGAHAADTTFDLIRKYQIPCDASQSGWIQAADTATALADARQRVQTLSKAGVPVRFLKRDEIVGLTGTQAYQGGWIDERCGTIQPLSYARGLAREAMALGARIFCKSRAVSIERKGAAWHVATASGSVTAPRLLIATTALTDGIWPRLSQVFLPVWSFQIATAPMSASDRAAILPGGQAVSDTRRILRYFRVDRDGRLVIGGKGKNTAPQSVKDFATQHHILARLYPHLADVPIEFRWGGKIAITIDRLPRIIDIGPNAYANFGCNGKGIAWCTAMGEAYATAFLEGSSRSLPIPVTPIRTIPLHMLRRFYVAAASSWYRFLDAME